MLQIVHGSVVDQRVDAIVNAANSGLMGGGGVDGAIHRAAGPKLDAACRVLHDEGGCATGDAKLTEAYGITWARHIVHTVGPVFSEHPFEEAAALLASCYERSCDLALEAGDSSIAFPAISCGVYGFPLERALPIAIDALVPYVARFDRIVLAMFTRSEFDRAREVAGELTRCHEEEGAVVLDL